MSEFVATIIFVTIMAIGAIAWLIAVRYTRKIGVSSSYVDWPTNLNTKVGHNCGELLCDASKEELMERIPKLLRRQSLSIVSSVFKLEEKNDNELSFQRIGPLICNLPTALYFSRVRFRLEAQSSNVTLVKYSIDQANIINLMRRIAMRVLFLGAFPIMIGIGLLMCCVVIPSPNLAIRGQVLQTLHILHAIWPAFMFVGIAVAARKATKQFIEQMLIVASDPELMCFADELIARGRPPVRTSSSVYL